MAVTPFASLGFVIALLAAPAAAVRKTELDEADMDVLSDPDKEAESLVEENLIPGFPDQFYCCCYQGPCYWEDHFKPAGRESLLDMNWYTAPVPVGDITGEEVLSCCFQVPKLLAKCPRGVILEEDKRLCSAEAYTPPEMSIDTCAAKIQWWLEREDWYYYLSDYELPGWFGPIKHQLVYKEYVPCLESKSSFVNNVLLSEASYFHSTRHGNPVMTYVTSREECHGLSEQDIRVAVEKVYDEMCDFPIVSESYRPNYNPETACSYNGTTTMIAMTSNTRCPEGHRCACPRNDPTPIEGRKGWLSGLGRGSFYVKALEGVAKTTAVAAWWGGPAFTGLTLATGGALAGGVGGTMLIVYGAKTAVEYLTHSCQAKVGCFPMDCVYEENVGCRINLENDGSDPRNPYWFMPPPLHKCGVNRWGNCHLAQCTPQEAKAQIVGEGTATYGVFRKLPRSVILNCQPTLAQDMTHKQIMKLEHKLTGLRSKAHENQRRTTILTDNMHRFCPFLQPTPYASAALCHDGTSCNMFSVPGPNCCLEQGHGGVKQCPSKFPLLCADDFCDQAIGQCRSRGGIKECEADDKCPWIMPTLEDDIVRCNDGSAVPTSDFIDGAAWCQGRSGLKSCPWNLPIMCAAQTCNGEYCCAAECSDLGGPRACTGLDSQQIRSALEAGALRSGQLAWQSLAAAFTLAVLRMALPLQ